MFWNRWGWWLHISVNVPNATELGALKWLILWYVGIPSIKKKFRLVTIAMEATEQGVVIENAEVVREASLRRCHLS